MFANAVLVVTKDTLLPLDEDSRMARLGARIARAVHETEALPSFSKKMMLTLKEIFFYTLLPNGHYFENSKMKRAMLVVIYRSGEMLMRLWILLPFRFHQRILIS